MKIFFGLVLTVWTLMHVYVFWRMASVPWVSAHVSNRTLALVGLGLWLVYPVARILSARQFDVVAVPLEFVGATWMGVLFLLLASLVLAEVVTGGGWWLSQSAPSIRGYAIVAAAALSLIAVVQGARGPVVTDHEVVLRGLPAEHDGLVLVAASDLHLGTLNGRRWTERLVERINELRPDLVAVVGDIVESTSHVQRLVPILERLHAPLGVWAVTGNHEYYAGVDRSVHLLESAGITVLRDRWEEIVPGLVLAGVDDLTGRRQFGDVDGHVVTALAGRPSGGAILLSHTPWEAPVAADAGAGLMLSGHTHAGQIWPFRYLVRLRYPLVDGRYAIGGLSVIVCRGTGTWGPPMRLFRRGELLRIRLRAAN